MYPLCIIDTTAVDKRRKISTETVFKYSMMENQWEKITSFKYFSACGTCVKLERFDLRF